MANPIFNSCFLCWAVVEDDYFSMFTLNGRDEITCDRVCHSSAMRVFKTSKFSFNPKYGNKTLHRSSGVYLLEWQEDKIIAYNKTKNIEELVKCATTIDKEKRLLFLSGQS